MRRVFRLFALAVAVAATLGAGAARAESPMTLTLGGPQVYRTGEPIEAFVGTLTLGPVGVLATIDVLVDGVLENIVTSDLNGFYTFELPPFADAVNHTVQTRAFGGLPIETLSPVRVVKPIFLVTATRAGAGGGAIMSAPPGIDCGATCSMYVVNETALTLTATPDQESSFAGWSGACAGTGDCSLVVTSDVNVTATFQPLPPAQFVINPTSFNFGSVVTGGVTPPMSFTLTNIGGLPSGTVAITLSGPDPSQFHILSTSCTSSLAPAQSCGITARFGPTTPGVKNATLTAEASPGGVATASLQGTGLAPAQLGITPTFRDFGSVSVFSGSATAGFTVFNMGQATSGPIGFYVTGPNAPEFQVVSSSCGAPLPGGAACSIVVRFDPSNFGTRTATLVAFANPGGTVLASMNGNGTF